MSDTKFENQLPLANTELSRQITLLEETLLEKEMIAGALQDSEKRYRRLFESAKDGILILDADTGKVVDVNPFLLQLLGYSYDVICGQHIWELGAFKDIAASKDAFKTLQDNESSVTMICRWKPARASPSASSLSAMCIRSTAAK